MMQDILKIPRYLSSTNTNREPEFWCFPHTLLLDGAIELDLRERLHSSLPKNPVKFNQCVQNSSREPNSHLLGLAPPPQCPPPAAMPPVPALQTAALSPGMQGLQVNLAANTTTGLVRQVETGCFDWDDADNVVDAVINVGQLNAAKEAAEPSQKASRAPSPVPAPAPAISAHNDPPAPPPPLAAPPTAPLAPLAAPEETHLLPPGTSFLPDGASLLPHDLGSTRLHLSQDGNSIVFGRPQIDTLKVTAAVATIDGNVVKLVPRPAASPAAPPPALTAALTAPKDEFSSLILGPQHDVPMPALTTGLLRDVGSFLAPGRTVENSIVFAQPVDQGTAILTAGSARLPPSMMFNDISGLSIGGIDTSTLATANTNQGINTMVIGAGLARREDSIVIDDLAFDGVAGTAMLMMQAKEQEDLLVTEVVAAGAGAGAGAGKVRPSKLPSMTGIL